VYLVLLSIFKDSIKQDVSHLEYVWRILLGLGRSLPSPAFNPVYNMLTQL
jgi:hypothetical protein